MGLNFIVFLCLIVATVWVASSSPVGTPVQIKVVKLTKAQSKQAVKDLESVLQKVLKKLKDAKAAQHRRDAEDEGLEVAVEAPESLDLTGDDVVNYLHEAVNQANDVDDVERRQLTAGLTYGRNGWGANAGYTWTSHSGNTRINLQGGWSQGGGWGAGIGFTFKL